MEEERGRLRLPRPPAAREECRQVRRVALARADRLLPPVRDGGQRGVGVLADGRNERRKRIGEVLVVPDAEPVAGHVDPAAEPPVVGVEGGQRGARISTVSELEAGLLKILEEPLEPDVGERVLDQHLEDRQRHVLSLLQSAEPVLPAYSW